MNQSTNGFRDPGQEGQDCIHGDCWAFGYNTQTMNQSSLEVPGHDWGGRVRPKAPALDLDHPDCDVVGHSGLARPRRAR